MSLLCMCMMSVTISKALFNENDVWGVWGQWVCNNNSFTMCYSSYSKTSHLRLLLKTQIVLWVKLRYSRCSAGIQNRPLKSHHTGSVSEEMSVQAPLKSNISHGNASKYHFVCSLWQNESHISISDTVCLLYNIPVS